MGGNTLNKTSKSKYKCLLKTVSIVVKSSPQCVAQLLFVYYLGKT